MQGNTSIPVGLKFALLEKTSRMSGTEGNQRRRNASAFEKEQADCAGGENYKGFRDFAEA